MSVLPPRSALAALAGLLLVALAFQGGRLSVRDGAPAAPGGGADAVSATAPDALERIAAERDVALAAAGRLEARLARAERGASDDAAELALYRRIESGEADDGLSIDAVELVAAGTPDAAVAVTLVQSRGRHRVSGEIGVRLVAVDEPEDSPSAGAPEAGSDASNAPDGEPAPDAIGEEAPPDGDSHAFDLRFFQTVRVPADDLGATAGRRVEIDVRPEGDRHARFIEIHPLDPTVPEPAGE